ncbi:MAG: DUF4857 domain-containing protein [Bacteroidales bacterium]
MEKVQRYILIFVSIIIGFVFIPEFYTKLTEKDFRTPFITYSSVLDDFILFRRLDDNFKRIDTKGNEYSIDEYEEKTPLMNYRQLLADKKFPDSILGIPMDVKEVQKHNLFLSLKPAYFDQYTIGLYPLFEASSGRVRLSLPKDLFRFTNNGIEFFDAKTNVLIKYKSDIFTEKFNSLNFEFPAQWIYGNPSPKKPYDLGYFVKDAKGEIFHLQMKNSKPSIYKTNIPKEANIFYISTYETATKKFYGFALGEDGGFYEISTDSYKLNKFPIPRYDYKKQRLRIFGNILFKNVILSDNSGIQAFAVDQSFFLKNKYSEKQTIHSEDFYMSLGEYLFPFVIHFKSKKHFNLKLNIDTSLKGLFLNLLFVLIFILYLKFNNLKFSNYWGEIIFVLTFGWMAWFAIIAFPSEFSKKKKGKLLC